MLVEEQKYLEKIIDKLRKELLTAPEGWRLCSFVLTGNSRAFFVRIQMSFLLPARLFISLPFYFIYSIMELTGSVVRGLKRRISDDLAASNVLFSALLQKE